METLIKRSFFLLVAALGMTSLHAQTADDIVNKYVDAIGGRSVVDGLKSMIVESTVDVNGQQGPNTTYILNGKGFKTETDFNGQKFVTSITPDSGWMINPMAGAETPTPVPADQLKSSQGQLQIGGPLLNYAANNDKIELLGKDGNDYKLKLTTPAGDVTFYINDKTYLIDKQVMQVSMGGQQMETTVTSSDYRKTDAGYVMAFAQTREFPQYTLNFTVNKVTINPTIDPSIFEMPK